MDYLLKTEPSEYGFADLVRDEKTIWDGIANPVALRSLREMKPGDRLVIYETGDRKCAVGTATVISVDADDDRSPRVAIRAGRSLPTPISLGTLKADRRFADSPLVKHGRLSVVPLTRAQYAYLVGE